MSTDLLWHLIAGLLIVCMLVISGPVFNKAISTQTVDAQTITAFATIAYVILTYGLFLNQEKINDAQFTPQAVLRNLKKRLDSHVMIYNCGPVPITKTQLNVYFAGELKDNPKMPPSDQLIPIRGYTYQRESCDHVIVQKEDMRLDLHDFISRNKINIQRGKLYAFYIFLTIYFEDFKSTTKKYEVTYTEQSNEDTSYYVKTFIREQWIKN